MISNILPFPRGTKFSDNQVELDGSAINPEGALFRVKDVTIHPGQEVELILRCVRNGSSSTLTIVSSGGVPELVKLSPDSDWPRKAVALGTGGNQWVRPADPEYPAGFQVAPGDLFYVVEEGFAKVRNDGTARVMGEQLTCNSSGQAAAATAVQFVFGCSMHSGAAGANSAITVYVYPAPLRLKESATTVVLG